MDQHLRDTILGSGRVSATDLQALEKRLRTMTVDQILLELDELTRHAEDMGKELDPHIILAYYNIMDELEPISVLKHAKVASKKRFIANHPEFSEIHNHRNSTRKPNQIFGNLFSRRIAIAVALLVVFTFSGAVIALEVPQCLVTWAEKTFSIGSLRGSDMRLETPTEEGFYTLDDALHFYGVSTYTPQWLPARFKLDDISISENEAWTSFIAVFSSNEGSTDSCVIKITSYNDSFVSPDIIYEDDGTGSRETREIGNLTIHITENMGIYRITCNSSNHLLSIFGNFSIKEVNQIVEHIQVKGE